MKTEKQILEAVRVLQEANPHDEGIQNWVRNYFPELKESDDERIIKRLIAMCKHYIECYALDPYNIDDYKEALAWLEKQNEQNLPIEKLPFEMKTVSESLGFTTQKECDDYNKMVTDLIMSDDGKGEQKPAWSKEDERIYQSILDDTVTETQLDDKQIIWLKSLKDRVGCEVNCTTTWKPSDEQMKQLHKYCPGNRPLAQLYQDLKKLRE